MPILCELFQVNELKERERERAREDESKRERDEKKKERKKENGLVFPRLTDAG